MRVPGPVGEGVVTAVDGDPADDLTLEAHRPRDRQRDPQRRDRGEAAVSQQPVEAHRHPQPGDHVEGQRSRPLVDAALRLASRPAPSTGTIHAMMLITGLLAVVSRRPV
jgi:hypothetical protein